MDFVCLADELNSGSITMDNVVVLTSNIMYNVQDYSVLYNNNILQIQQMYVQPIFWKGSPNSIKRQYHYDHFLERANYIILNYIIIRRIVSFNRTYLWQHMTEI
jgi:hypothetical protein